MADSILPPKRVTELLDEAEKNLTKGRFNDNRTRYIDEDDKGYRVILAEALEKKVKNSARKYERPLHFKSAYICGNLDLKEIDFQKKVTFIHCVFSDIISFEGSRFPQETSFATTLFLKNAFFEDVHFDNYLSFNKAQFAEKALFIFAQFVESASFEEAQFGENSSFFNAQFGENTSFEFARFVKNTNFRAAQFGENTSFFNAQFAENAFFNETQFGENTSFEFARFADKASFEHANFKTNTRFHHTIFGNELNFNNCLFKGVASFNHSEFKGAVKFRLSSYLFDELSFEDVRLNEVNDIRFWTDFDMINVLFKDSDISKMDFHNVKWHQEKSRYVVGDELLIREPMNKDYFKDTKELKDKKKEKDNKIKYWKELQRIYGVLRVHYEEKKDFDSSERFYHSEMNAKRQTANWFTRYIIMGFYWLTADFSQSVLRPILSLIVLIFAFSFLYAVTGLEVKKEDVSQFNKTSPVSVTQVKASQKKKTQVKPLILRWDDFLTQDSNQAMKIGRLFDYTIKISFYQKDLPFKQGGVYTTILNVIQFGLTVLIVTFLVFAVRKRFKR